MIKKILIGIVKVYQKIPGSFHGYCKHVPSCSNYMIEALETHGVFKGLYLNRGEFFTVLPLETLHTSPW